MSSTGILRKMRVTLTDPVTYGLRIGDDEIKLNPILGKPFKLRFNGAMFCIQCARKITKTFQQGYCFPCLRRIHECGNCMLHPERCRVEEGCCPKDDWAHAQCHEAHYVYLANSSRLKVGVTRHSQIPTRWMDQGTSAALPIIKVSNRRQAGCVEVIFKQFVHDKTNWHEMLKNNVPHVKLTAERDRLLEMVDSQLSALRNRYDASAISILEHEQPVLIHYPVLQAPNKVTSLSFDNTPEISGILQGIKGQYVMLDSGVMNIRKFGGYEVVMHTDHS